MPCFDLYEKIAVPLGAVGNLSTGRSTQHCSVTRIEYSLEARTYFYTVSGFEKGRNKFATDALRAIIGYPSITLKPPSKFQKLFQQSFRFKYRPQEWVEYAGSYDMEFFDGKPARVVGVEQRQTEAGEDKTYLDLAFHDEDGSWFVMDEIGFYPEDLVQVHAPAPLKTLLNLRKVTF